MSMLDRLDNFPSTRSFFASVPDETAEKNSLKNRLKDPNVVITPISELNPNVLQFIVKGRIT